MRTLISNNRTEIMGISIIWIILHHIQYFGLTGFGLLDYLVRGGNIGVDIFLFLSAFGLYHSYNKNNNISFFYRKRLIRILPTFIILVIAYNILTGHFKSIFNPWMWYWQFYGNWFISFILIMYLIFPIFYKLQKRNLYCPLIITTIVSILLTVILIILRRNDIHDLPMLMAQRSPVFVLGMLVADKRYSFNIDYKWLFIFCILIIPLVFYFQADDILYPLYFLLTYPLIILLSKANQKSPIFLQKTLHWIGERSLELYLVHMIITPMFQEVAIPISIKIIFVFAISIGCAILLKAIVSLLLKTIKIYK